MLNLNSICMTGRAVKDAETKKIGSGTVTSFRIVNNRLFQKKNGEKEERATYIDCETWDKRAEYAAERVKKGTHLLIQGRLECDEWTDKKSGEKRSRLKVYVENLQVDSNSKADGTSPKKKEDAGDSEAGEEPSVSTEELPF